MRLLLDESVPRQLERALPGHVVRTVQQEGWSGTKNGELLELAAAGGFDALISCDQGIEHQQNPERLPIPVVILKAPTNRLEHLSPLMGSVAPALERVSKPCFVTVGG